MHNNTKPGYIPEMNKLSKTIGLKISPELKKRLEQVQKDERRSTLSDTIRAILLKWLDDNDEQ